MSLSRITALSVAAAVLLIASFTLASERKKPSPQVIADPASMQKVISQLQMQIDQVASRLPQQLAAQNALNQKAISQLQKQTQAQFNHLQSELNKLQTKTMKAIAQLQKEVQQEARIK